MTWPFHPTYSSIKKQPLCTVFLGSARDLPHRFRQAPGVPRSWVPRQQPGPPVLNVPGLEERTDGLDRGAKQPIHLEQVISQPLDSSTISPLRHFGLVSQRTRLLSTSTPPPCLFASHSPVCSNFHPSASYLSGRVLLPFPSLTDFLHPNNDTRIPITAHSPPPPAPYLDLRPRCAIGNPSVITTKDGNGAIVHLHEELGCWPTTFDDG